MNVLYLSESVIPSQRANTVHVIKMCSALTEHKMHVSLIAQKGIDFTSITQILDDYGINKTLVIYLNKPLKIWGGLYLYGLKSLRLILTLKPQLVYSRFLFGTFLISYFYPFVFEIHSAIWKTTFLNRLLFYLIIRSPKLKFIVSITHALKEDLLLFKKDANVVVLPDGADLPTTQDFEKFDSKFVNVGYVGSLYPGKGMEVIREISKGMSDFIFHIVGGTTKQLAYWKPMMPEENVIFHGHVSNCRVSNYLNSFDICLLPNQEIVKTGMKSDIGKYTSPLKMFEYMAHRKAIVASNLPVIKEILNEKNAWLVNPTDYEGWKNALLTLRNKHVREKLATQAFIDISTKYTWSIRAQRIGELISTS